MGGGYNRATSYYLRVLVLLVFCKRGVRTPNTNLSTALLKTHEAPTTSSCKLRAPRLFSSISLSLLTGATTATPRELFHSKTWTTPPGKNFPGDPPQPPCAPYSWAFPSRAAPRSKTILYYILLYNYINTRKGWFCLLQGLFDLVQCAGKGGWTRKENTPTHIHSSITYINTQLQTHTRGLPTSARGLPITRKYTHEVYTQHAHIPTRFGHTHTFAHTQTTHIHMRSRHTNLHTHTHTRGFRNKVRIIDISLGY